MFRTDPFAYIGFDGSVLAGFDSLAELKGGYTPDDSYRGSIPNAPFDDQTNAGPFTGTLMEPFTGILMGPSGAPGRLHSGEALNLSFALGGESGPNPDAFISTQDATRSIQDAARSATGSGEVAIN